MDYQKTGLEVLAAVGGKDNVKNVTHCATRLRFRLADSSGIDKAGIEKIDGVLKCVEGGGQFQVVVGPNVTMAYQAIADVCGEKQDAGERTDAVHDSEKKSLAASFLATISGIFTPILSALVAAGMLKAVLSILRVSGLIDTAGQTYQIINLASDAAFYFLPIMLAASCAKVFKMNTGLAMLLGAMMQHPTFVGLASAGNPVSLLGIPVRLVSYSSTVVPIVIVVFVASHVEHFADKYLPEVIKYVVKPLVVMLVMIPLAFCVLGPIGAYVGDGLAWIISSINAVAPWMIPTLMGAFCPILVMFGLHNGLVPIVMNQLTVQGFENINGPGMLASNIAQGAASLAVSIKAKDVDVKQTSLTTGFTALMGITEPAMYGITLRYKNVLPCVVVGGGVAGFFAGISGLVRYAYGAPGLPTLPCFMGDNPMNIVKALLTVAISFVVTFILCLIFAGVEEKK